MYLWWQSSNSCSTIRYTVLYLCNERFCEKIILGECKYCALTKVYTLVINLNCYVYEAGFSCPPGSVHDFYPDLANCSNFYECSDGNAYHKFCRTGLYFNPTTKVCDFPSNVNCPVSGNTISKYKRLTDPSVNKISISKNNFARVYRN